MMRICALHNIASVVVNLHNAFLTLLTSDPTSLSGISPEVVAAIDDLELAARIVVEGLRTGGHRSPFHGYSTEFRQHRPYRAGDDLKYLDWKLFARSDRLYTRQFRETTNLSVMLVLDTSASMAYPLTGLSKARYATIIAAALAWSRIARLFGMQALAAEMHARR